MLRAGIGSAPVLLTLASRPVLGGVCTQASAVGSLQGSHTAASATYCSGRSPAAWVSTKEWPIPYYRHNKSGRTATPYHCTTTGLGGACFASDLMVEVMQYPDDGGLKSLGRYVSAALLNSRSGLTPVLTEAKVRDMWNDYMARQYFEPTAGIRWGAPQIIAYIKSTIA